MLRYMPSVPFVTIICPGFTSFCRSELLSSTKPRCGLWPAAPSETSMWSHSIQILWVLLLKINKIKSNSPLDGLCLTLSFFPVSKSRWMETRRAWLPLKWTHGTKVPTQPIVSTCLQCRATDHHFCQWQKSDRKLSSVERQTLARVFSHYVM